MANELNTAISQTGLVDLVAQIYSPNWVQQGGNIAMTEVSSGKYTGSVPAATLASNAYRVLFARTAALTTILAEGDLLWDSAGDKEVVPAEAIEEIWKDRGLDADASKTITENTVGEDYDELVDGIAKSVTKVGTVTTIDRP